ncbi:uncharacterized protein ACR2FA_000221, partial [Aphomia sociella]
RRADPPPRLDPPPPPPPPAQPAQTDVRGEPVAITINRVKLDDRAPRESKAEADKPRADTTDKSDDQCYVRNSSFLSRDIEAQKTKAESQATKKVKSASPVVKIASPTRKVLSPPAQTPSPPPKDVPVRTEGTPPRNVASPPTQRCGAVATPPRREAVSPPNRDSSLPSKTDSPPVKTQIATTNVVSPPVSAKLNKTDSKGEDSSVAPKLVRKDSFVKEAILKNEKLSLSANGSIEKPPEKISTAAENNKDETASKDKAGKGEESNGVGDKIKKFEKAAEDASVVGGGGGGVGGGGARAGRSGSGRGRALCDRFDDLPPPATPFKDNVHFDLGPTTASLERGAALQLDRQQSATKSNSPNPTTVKWQRSDSGNAEPERIKPEPQKIVKPEFKPIQSQVDVTIRSPSLGTKIGDQFPSHGTAFRNVASPDPGRSTPHKFDDDVNTQNNFKACKSKNKEKYSVSKGSSYFTRGSEEIWLVKKKDIEEIEERVLDSFRRAGGNVCLRSESTRATSEGGAAFPHATTGRGKRQAYARSESLDPGRAARAHTLKRQSSVACTCGHDKKTRPRPTDAPRPRSRSHGDDAQPHVLDKYETLV